jgi:anaerobic selenocysteine-containing dehydrogenase
MPDQEKVRAGLAREDLFTVVFDQVMTDTARYADVVLPATTFLERREVSRGYGAMVLHDARPAIAPVGESRSNHEVFAELCRRLGLEREGDLDDADALASALFASSRRGDELVAALAARGGTVVGYDGAPPVQMVDVRPRTSDGKIRLVPEDLDHEAPHGLYAYQGDPATPRFPLALVSPATNRTISSTLGQLYRKQAALELHPDDAAARGIAGGDEVRVWNELGEVRCRARVARDLRPGVAMLPKGLWSHNTLNGATSNALAPSTLTDLAGGACFNDARVQVEKTG